MLLYHYTTNQSLLSILESGGIWLSDFSVANDLLEGRWVKKVFSSYCEQKNVPENQLKELLLRLDGLSEIVGAVGFCLSEEGDLLSQWRGYADDAAGVSIGFDRDYLENLSKAEADRKIGFFLTKIEYELAQQERTIQPEIEGILREVENGAFLHGRSALLIGETDPELKKKQGQAHASLMIRFLMLFQYLYVFKNPAFSEEREWRLVGIVPRSHKEDDPGLLKELGYRVKNGKLVPYLPVKLAPTDRVPIRELILGPRNPTPPKVFYGLLHKSGYGDVRIRRSDSSYR